METKDIIYNLRTKNGLSQDELAEKVFVTRQAVSRWENGETTPNTETLKLLSELFRVSINTLLGSPRKLICQCCGMPLEDSILSKEKDGSYNEDYCQWCYDKGRYTYQSMDDLIEVCIPHMVNDNFSPEQARAYMKGVLPNLDYWKNHSEKNQDNYEAIKCQLIAELNALEIKGLPKIERLNALTGNQVNLSYLLPSGVSVKFLDEKAIYFGNQLPSSLGEGRYFGVLGNEDFLLVSSYKENGEDPQLLLYRKR